MSPLTCISFKGSPQQTLAHVSCSSERQGVGFTLCPSSIPVTVTFGVCHAAKGGRVHQQCAQVHIDTVQCVCVPGIDSAAVEHTPDTAKLTPQE